MSFQTASKLLLSSLIVVACAGPAAAQLPNPYGLPINSENAKKVAAAALAEARKNGWREIAAVVDPAGDLVYLEKMDDAQTASVELAIDKARSAVRFKRSTKVFEDAVAGGGAGLRFLGFPGVLPTDGGLPIVIDGRIVGAIGVSGATGAQDGQCAAAGAAALK